MVEMSWRSQEPTSTNDIVSGQMPSTADEDPITESVDALLHGIAARRKAVEKAPEDHDDQVAETLLEMSNYPPSLDPQPLLNQSFLSIELGNLFGNTDLETPEYL